MAEEIKNDERLVAPKFANSVSWNVNESGTQLTFSFVPPENPRTNALVADFMIPNELAMNMSIEVAKLVKGLEELHKGSQKKN